MRTRKQQKLWAFLWTPCLLNNSRAKVIPLPRGYRSTKSQDVKRPKSEVNSTSDTMPGNQMNSLSQAVMSVAKRLSTVICLSTSHRRPELITWYGATTQRQTKRVLLAGVKNWVTLLEFLVWRHTVLCSWTGHPHTAANAQSLARPILLV